MFHMILFIQDCIVGASLEKKKLNTLHWHNILMSLYEHAKWQKWDTMYVISTELKFLQEDKCDNSN